MPYYRPVGRCYFLFMVANVRTMNLLSSFILLAKTFYKRESYLLYYYTFLEIERKKNRKVP